MPTDSNNMNGYQAELNCQDTQESGVSESGNHTDVCMVVKNQLWNDARVKKEAQTLSDSGLSVTIIAQPEAGSPETEIWGSIRIQRVQQSGNLKSSFRRILDTSEGNGARKGSRLVATLRKNPVKRFLGDLFHTSLYDAKLLQHALRTNAEVYHAHDLDTLAVCAAAAYINNGRLVYDAHELWLESRRHLLETSRPFMILEKLTESLLAPIADAVIAVTPGRANVMREMYPTMAVPDLVVNYPLMTPVAPRQEDVRRKLGVKNEPCFLFLYQGILGLHRGLEELIDASIMLRGLPVHIAFVGHDRSGGVITQYAEEKNAGDMVTFHPPVPSEELAGITGSADAGLLLFQGSCLNHTLSLPNKLFEYMMSGLPVIACDLPEISTVINRHGCGILVDSSDPPSIANGIRQMASDPVEAKAQGERGYDAASTDYIWNQSARILRELYMRVLEEELHSLPVGDTQ